MNTLRHHDRLVLLLCSSVMCLAKAQGEGFVEIGLELKKRHSPTFTVSPANAYHGYLPTPEHHALGGYETWRARSSCLEVDASTKILAGLEERFETLK